jgi:catechol 2,3-dioxygenase-like lactoylglutathione lyase family enzyme
MLTQLKTAIPKLASLNIERSVDFFEKLGFSKVASYPNYAVVRRDSVEIHFWLCNDSRIPGETGCRINVEGIDALFKDYSAKNIVHPKDPLSLKPWGLREFSIVDVDGNLVTFAEASA